MNRNQKQLLAIALCFTALGCSKSEDNGSAGNASTGPVEYDIAIGTGEEDDATGCLQMGRGNGEVVFGVSSSRLDESGQLSNAQCVVGLILVEGEAYFISGTEHDVALMTPDADEDGLQNRVGAISQVAREGEFELRVFPKGQLDDGEPLFVGQLKVSELDVEDGTARVVAD